ncbi:MULTISPECIES: divalent-cation tolerance protein CutA [Rhodomicrobium]|uniref:divalent-cation tolerance protein CutA n=1 Tax=Rhodomicrobium TaxID=1068 RepID=UPI000B4AA938|nr:MULTISPECIES: divalent-cation tolerance protein CutA [Rhodomicrobium]
MSDTDDDKAASRPIGAESVVPQTADDTAALLIYTTFPSEADAKSVGRALVEARLAACVNLLPGVIAIFRWQDRLEEAAETGMIVKTTQGRAAEALAEIKRLHPYETPARLLLPVAGGGADFLRWIAGEVAGPRS